MSKRVFLLYVLIGLQVAAGVSLIMLAVLFSAVQFDSGFGKGLQDSVCKYVGIDDVRDFGAEQAGYVVGSVFFPLTLLSVAAFGIRKRRRYLAVVSFILLLLIQLGQGSIPILPLICLVLLIAPIRTRIWDRQEN